MNIGWKKISIILAITAIVLITGVIVVNYINSQNELAKDRKNKEQVVNISRDFSQAWYNYSKQTDPSYLNKIKPYMTADFYDDTSYINLNRPQDFVDQPSLKSTVEEITIDNYTLAKAQVGATVSSTEGKTTKQKTDKVNLTLENNNGKWLVSNLSTSDE